MTPDDDRRPRLSRGDPTTVVFGRRAVLEALRTPEVECVEVRCDARLPGALRDELHTLSRERGAAFDRTTGDRVHALSGEPKHDQGIAALVRLLRVTSLEGFVSSCYGAAARRPIGVLALDGLTNSQNVGMIVRSAVAAGIDAVLWPSIGMPWLNGLVVKSSASTVYRCPIVRCHALSEALVTLQSVGFRVHGLVASGGEALAHHRPPHRSVYVVGSERDGLSAAVQAGLDEALSIPMRGPVESLNAAVAAALLLFRWADAVSEIEQDSRGD